MVATKSANRICMQQIYETTEHTLKRVHFFPFHGQGGGGGEGGDLL